MANLNQIVMATIAISMGMCQSSNADLMRSIFHKYGVDSEMAQSLMDEMLLAKSVAEADMASEL